MSEPRYQLSGQYLLGQEPDVMVILPEDLVIFSDTASLRELDPNDTAAFLWRTFEQPRTAEQAVQLALNEYEGDEAMIRAQVCGFVQAALECQILKEADPLVRYSCQRRPERLYHPGAGV